MFERADVRASALGSRNSIVVVGEWRRTVWIRRVDRLLRDAGYDQSPQLEGRSSAKTRKVFR